uniref:Uncharacterized protein n=1 Tax=Onchocerca volvulus TaxID=6282 RepID=A0A8R1XM51_ONCVO
FLIKQNYINSVEIDCINYFKPNLSDPSRIPNESLDNLGTICNPKIVYNLCINIKLVDDNKTFAGFKKEGLAMKSKNESEGDKKLKKDEE